MQQSGLIGVIKMVGQLIDWLLPLVIALTVLVFVWGLFKLVLAGDSEDARKEARGYIMWGIVALFVMVSVWGLVNILIRSFALSNGLPPMPAVPGVDGTGSGSNSGSGSGGGSSGGGTTRPNGTWI
ncbi:MAG: hypothetical protein FGM57_02460 [Candidatus Taylorbacteria bacterium]|nr:hypothetical protein [Candidatus Taylorbacteria bacterium]